jgi:hypothetical protein
LKRCERLCEFRDFARVLRDFRFKVFSLREEARHDMDDVAHSRVVSHAFKYCYILFQQIALCRSGFLDEAARTQTDHRKH